MQFSDRHFRSGFRRISLFLGLMGAFSGIALVSQYAFSQEDASSAPSTPSEISQLPEVFTRAVPASLDELRAIQAHVTKLVPGLKECTVNVRIGNSQGTGVIVTGDGLILSAAHVTGTPGSHVVILMDDGSTVEGVTLGRNTTLDASMVKITSVERTDWPHRPLATETVVPGNWCLTLGHPGGYRKERGLVLRLGRIIERNSWVLRSDCELVGGDSGGPLFDMRGEVIGINTRIGESTTVNFHVPGTAFQRDWDRLVAGEDFKTHSGAYLGVGGQAAEGNGFLIEIVEPDSPADRQGLKVGDVIKTFQGQEVPNIDRLIELVGEETPGRTVRLSILRGEETKTVSVRLAMRWNR
ncbi:S1C family serine protease [Planctomicrobium sp. SH668]|uniref:S1C family serine protease n=1 Tax=Planctomicrobium sp. SH668 TaxID=3448126 RepID=UPI003F5C2235